MRWRAALTLLPGLWLAACDSAIDPAVTPDSDVVATRVVTLAPHLAELVYAAGAGSLLVGVSDYTNYPDDVLSLPIVGDAFRVDQEQLALLRPDLLLAWDSGTPAHIVDSLQTRGYRVELIRTQGLADISRALVRIGKLTGTVSTAQLAAERHEDRLKEIAATWQSADSIRVFYQVSQRPLYTVNGRHYISELVTLCGGENVFADLGELAPMISEEAVLQRDPEILLAADAGGEAVFSEWSYWQDLAANRYDNHFVVPADAVARPTDRVYIAGEAICQRLHEGRKRRAAATSGS